MQAWVLFKETEADGFIKDNYDLLHTQGLDYLLDDIQWVYKQKEEMIRLYHGSTVAVRKLPLDPVVRMPTLAKDSIPRAIWSRQCVGRISNRNERKPGEQWSASMNLTRRYWTVLI